MSKLFQLLKSRFAEILILVGVLLFVTGILDFDSSIGCGRSGGRVSRLGRLVGCEGTVAYYYSEKANRKASIGAVLVVAGLLTIKRKS